MLIQLRVDETTHPAVKEKAVGPSFRARLDLLQAAAEGRRRMPLSLPVDEEAAGATTARKLASSQRTPGTAPKARYGEGTGPVRMLLSAFRAKQP
ncbi:MAG TPA: hypothetical protein VGR26_05035 [Acidimicrobiales bacterium]|nr:hypothetical protein [Acidimicrobiales bacterium]